MSLTARIFSKGSVAKNSPRKFNDTLFNETNKSRITKDIDDTYYIYPRRSHGTYGPYNTYKEALKELRKHSKK